MSGIDRIAAERLRQIEREGWTAEHDDEHTGGELARAACAYAIDRPDIFPWDAEWFKVSTLADGLPNRVRMLEKAGALIAAEIDRLLRTRPVPTVGGSSALNANPHPDGCHTSDAHAYRDCESDGHYECASCTRNVAREG